MKYDPDCTTVGSTDTVTENIQAIPSQDQAFNGWTGGWLCGADNCKQDIDYDHAQNAQIYDIQANFGSTATPQAATYTYNYLGQRDSKTINSITTYYVYDEQGHLLSELDSSGNSIKDYVYMDGEYVAHVEQTGDTSNSENQEQLFYEFNDHLGQPYMEWRSDEKGSSEQYFTPFGQTYVGYTNSSVGSGPTQQNIRFPGQYYDAETGYSQNWNRDYDPSIGAELQPDLLDAVGRTNDPQLLMEEQMELISLPEGLINNQSYGYAVQNPVNNIDPFGLVWWNPFSWFKRKIRLPDDWCAQTQCTLEACATCCISMGTRSGSCNVQCHDSFINGSKDKCEKEPPSCPVDKPSL